MREVFMPYEDDLKDAREASRLAWTLGVVSVVAAAAAVTLLATL
jgi:hypothetical protein